MVKSMEMEDTNGNTRTDGTVWTEGSPGKRLTMVGLDASTVLSEQQVVSEEHGTVQKHDNTGSLDQMLNEVEAVSQEEEAELVTDDVMLTEDLEGTGES